MINQIAVFFHRAKTAFLAHLGVAGGRHAGKVVAPGVPCHMLDSKLVQNDRPAALLDAAATAALLLPLLPAHELPLLYTAAAAAGSAHRQCLLCRRLLLLVAGSRGQQEQPLAGSRCKAGRGREVGVVSAPAQQRSMMRRGAARRRPTNVSFPPPRA